MSLKWTDLRIAFYPSPPLESKSIEISCKFVKVSNKTVQ
jgi:hypothetical protein